MLYINKLPKKRPAWWKVAGWKVTISFAKLLKLENEVARKMSVLSSSCCLRTFIGSFSRWTCVDRTSLHLVSESSTSHGRVRDATSRTQLCAKFCSVSANLSSPRQYRSPSTNHTLSRDWSAPATIGREKIIIIITIVSKSLKTRQKSMANRLWVCLCHFWSYCWKMLSVTLS